LVGEIKVKIILVHGKKARREAEVYLHSSLILVLGGGDWSASRFGSVTSKERFLPVKEA
jgi:hypothetical protein